MGTTPVPPLPRPSRACLSPQTRSAFAAVGYALHTSLHPPGATLLPLKYRTRAALYRRYKIAPFHPTTSGSFDSSSSLTSQDAANLHAWGFNVVRLGIL